VLAERCVACGRCVGVCAQKAKQVVSRLPRIRELLGEPDPVAMLAPSFPAAFADVRPGQVVAALRRIGFKAVVEVAFGADLVSRAYHELRTAAPDRLLLSSPCPAANAYVEKYVPELVPYLAPVLSPMAALGKALKLELRPGCRTVFFGPCLAKMREREESAVAPWVDAATTFSELRALLAEHGCELESLADEPMDGPLSKLGALYPIPGGLLHVADLAADPLTSENATVVGRESFTDTTRRLREHLARGTLGRVEARFFDVLFCKGCLGGPDMPRGESPIVRRERITRFVRERLHDPSAATSAQALERLTAVTLDRSFSADPQQGAPADPDAIREVLARTNKHQPRDELNCGACGYPTCREKAVAVLEGVAEVEMCLPFLVERLQAMVMSLNQSHEELQDAQDQLLRAERLASMGQLAAGIAHELNNPLGTILIYAHLLEEEQQAQAAAPSSGAEHSPPHGQTLLAPNDAHQQTIEDAQMIVREATRCKTIVAGLLHFARQNKVDRAPVQLRPLFEEAVQLVRVQVDGTAVTFDIDAPDDLPPANLDAGQMTQVLVNLVRNAVEAMPEGGTVTLRARWHEESAEHRITVADTGPGIPREHLPKLFAPFFTTKPVGRGTGLGLPICYGIVKMHRGTIVARNGESGVGAQFEISLPRWNGSEAGHDAILPSSG
jgi:signal transduction histidine kinase